MIRRLAEGDELLPLLNRCLRYDPLTPALLREKLEQGPAYVWDEDGLRGFCHGVPSGSIKLIAVDPGWRRRGIGSRLLQAVVAELPPGRLRAIENVPNYLVPGLDVRYTEAILFFERHGFTKFGECFNLTCDVTDAEAKPAPPGFEVRRATVADGPLIMAFLQEHFAGWQSEVQTMLGNAPISLHLAFQQDELLGFAGTDGNNLGTGWFGPMGTHPERRNTGVGGVLLSRCLEDFKHQGLTRCTIPWVGPWRFYARQCGATIDRVFWRYERNQD